MVLNVDIIATTIVPICGQMTDALLAACCAASCEIYIVVGLERLWRWCVNTFKILRQEFQSRPPAVVF